MASNWRSVMAWRGSAGSAHSGTGARASRSSRPSPTRIPTTACSMDLAIDQLRSGTSAVTGVGGRSKCSSAPWYRSKTMRPWCTMTTACVVAIGLVSSNAASSSGARATSTPPGSSPTGQSSVGQGTSPGWRGSGSRRLTPVGSPGGVEERQQRRVRLGRAFLLDPVARRPRRPCRRGTRGAVPGHGVGRARLHDTTGSRDPVRKPLGMV